MCSMLTPHLSVCMSAAANNSHSVTLTKNEYVIKIRDTGDKVFHYEEEITTPQLTKQEASTSYRHSCRLF